MVDAMGNGRTDRSRSGKVPGPLLSGIQTGDEDPGGKTPHRFFAVERGRGQLLERGLVRACREGDQVRDQTPGLKHGSEGLYEIEGLAPGVYTLTAYAAGFVPRTLATQITVRRGQSIHGVDIYVCPTAKLQTKVYSKCPTGPVNWPAYVTMDGFPASLAILPVVPGGPPDSRQVLLLLLRTPSGLRDLLGPPA